MTRVAQALADNMATGIPANWTTAALAADLMRGLKGYIQSAELDPAKLLPARPDVSRFCDLIQARRKETRARYFRRRKHRLRSAGPLSAEVTAGGDQHQPKPAQQARPPRTAPQPHPCLVERRIHNRIPFGYDIA